MTHRYRTTKCNTGAFRCLCVPPVEEKNGPSIRREPLVRLRKLGLPLLFEDTIDVDVEFLGQETFVEALEGAAPDADVRSLVLGPATDRCVCPSYPKSGTADRNGEEPGHCDRDPVEQFGPRIVVGNFHTNEYRQQ